MAEVLGLVVTTAEYNQSYRKAAWGKFPYPVKRSVMTGLMFVVDKINTTYISILIPSCSRNLVLRLLLIHTLSAIPLQSGPTLPLSATACNVAVAKAAGARTIGLSIFKDPQLMPTVAALGDPRYFCLSHGSLDEGLECTG